MVRDGGWRLEMVEDDGRLRQDEGGLEIEA